MRRIKPLPEYSLNGWVIQKCPHSFSEEFAYKARAFNAEGYQLAVHGFQSRRAADAFASNTEAPKQ